jgi:hypothetical protein
LNLLEFQERFPDEDACERYLIEQRWPEVLCASLSVQKKRGI